MKRIRLTIAYDGTNYCGWQIQPNAITIEEVLNKALRRLTKEEITVIGASRTDSGVHARANIAVFDTESTIPPDRFAVALNQKLPEDIVITMSEEVDSGWHPRYQDQIIKTYEYRIVNSPVLDPMKRLYSYQVTYQLDVEQMRRAAAFIVGKHDFASFCNVRTNAKTTVRTVTDLSIVQSEDEIILHISGDGFLYNMVRIIVGTLLRVGRGFYTPEDVKEIVEAKNRMAAGVTVPPQGLMLVEIKYTSEFQDEEM
ncbi:MAG: tRNA pseudouridine(38-40) synthase TruA [Hespellia sp.]|nr:tRNA pseudouridine(38-40) synthase TruA [Hespellia sp.]